MSIQRAEWPVFIATAAEFAGAEEGLRELERAIGRAKAMGHDHSRLERRLAAARAGIRRFRREHLERAKGEGQRGLAEELAANETMEQPRMEEPGAIVPGSGPSVPPTGAWADAVPDSLAARANWGGAEEEFGGATFRRQGADGCDREVVNDPGSLLPGTGTPLGQPGGDGQTEPPIVLTDVAGGAVEGAAAGGEAAGGPESSGAMGGWDEEVFRREFQGMLRAILEEQEKWRAEVVGREAKEAKEARRLAELETRVQQVEERRRLNREGG